MERFATITTVTMWLFSLSEGTLAGILQMAFGIGALLIKAPLVGLIMLIVIPYNLVASFRAVSKTKPLRRKWNRLVGTMSGLLSELVSQIATVRSFAGEHAVKRRYDAVQEEWEETRRVELDIEQRSGAELNLVNTLAVVAAIALVTLGALRGAMTPGDVLLILTLTQGLITTIQPITRLVNTTGDVDAAAERLVELLDVAPTVLDAPDAVPLTDIRSIEFRDVGFAYPGKTRAALSNVSFTLDAGQSLALVGPSGSGKSTVIKLLMRLYDPTSGVVLINDRDIRAYTQQSLRGLFGVVLQDVALFNDTIAENLGFARPGAPREAVVAAAEAAHADTFIRQLPESYETMVGERGVRLSGGEKQRIAIARALLRDPSLIILDEATSALDSESERLVQEGLNRLMRGRTAIVIAHRLSTIANADKILVMQGGTIVERGSHGALLSQSDGLYARLHALQGTAAALP
jgi:ABC-type multidrug transport system fused ATPase/permease subunit